MPTVEEMSAWSSDDVLTHVRLMLRPGWGLEIKHNDTTKVFFCYVLADKETLWSEEHSDLRLLLLDLYGWLLIRGGSTSNPMWSRARSAPPVARDDLGLEEESAPDPGDLDPNEVQALYRKAGY